MVCDFKSGGLIPGGSSMSTARNRRHCRKRVEEVFGWIKMTGGVAQVKVRGLAKVQAVFTFAILANNLVRIPKLLEAT
jgi:hypothetical protein